MNKNVVHLGSQDIDPIRLPLTDAEATEMQSLIGHPSTLGHILFDEDAEILTMDAVDEMSAPVFANVFDLCETLGGELGESIHTATTFETRGMEISCLRWNVTRLVVFRSKGSKKIGG